MNTGMGPTPPRTVGSGPCRSGKSRLGCGQAISRCGNRCRAANWSGGGNQRSGENSGSTPLVSRKHPYGLSSPVMTTANADRARA